MQTPTEGCRWGLYTTKKPQTKAKQESRSSVSFLQVTLNTLWAEDKHCWILLLISLVLLPCLFPQENLNPKSPQSQDANYSLRFGSSGCPGVSAAQELHSIKLYSRWWNQKGIRKNLK